MKKKNAKNARAEDMMNTFHSVPPKTTAERLRLWRNIRGLSQTDMADLVGWDNPSTYSKIECGKSNLTPERAEKCASVLGVTKEYLLCKDNDASFLHSIYDNVVDAVHDQINHENELIIEGKVLELLGIRWDVPTNKAGDFISGDITVRFNDGSSFKINERQNDFLHVFAHDTLVALYDTMHNYCVTSTKLISKGGDADE